MTISKETKPSLNVQGAKVVMHEKSPVRKDIAVKDGDTIEVGSVKLKVFHTPGHCPDHICLLVDGKLLDRGHLVRWRMRQNRLGGRKLGRHV